MTVQTARFAAAVPDDRATAIDVAAFAASVLVLIVFSQAWVFPLMGEKADPSASGLIRALYLPAYACGVGVLALGFRASLVGVLRQPFLVLLMLIAGMSILWSVSPDQSLRRVVALYLSTLCGVALAGRWRWSRLAEVIAAAFAILAVCSFLAGLLLPHVGRMEAIFPGAWRGLWSEKNAMGGNMALAFVLCLAAAALSPRRALIWCGSAVLCLLLVVLSTSKTSLVSLILGLGGFVMVALLRRGPVVKVATVWTALVSVLLIGGVALFAVDAVFGVLGKDATLTGRTKIWAAIMTEVRNRPWTGVGYGVAWDDLGPWGPLARITKAAGFQPEHAHNSWLEQWLGMGLFGLSAFAMLYVQTIVAALVAAFRSSGAWLAVPFLVVYTMTTLTESVAVTYNDLRWVLFVAIAVKLMLPDPPDGAALVRR